MKIILIGSGNVATHLGAALQQAGHQILQVWSRSMANARQLADLLSASATDDLNELNEEGDIFIIAVKDDVISRITSSFSFKDKIVVHTSGTVPMQVLSDTSAHVGVFYPLQTFSKEKAVDFAMIPILIESNSESLTLILKSLALSISNAVYNVSSEKRTVIHIAAVFACNFTNYLYSVSQKILEKEGLEFDLLKPLIAETAGKIQLYSPADVQTGPAFRKDYLTLDKHKEYLNAFPELKIIYEQLSNAIMDTNDISGVK